MLIKSGAIGWTMASEIEEYLDRFDEVKRLTQRLFVLADKISTLGNMLGDNDKRAFAAIPNDWPTKEELQALVQELESAKAQLSLYWSRIPERMRASMHSSRPEVASQTHLFASD